MGQPHIFGYKTPFHEVSLGELWGALPESDVSHLAKKKMRSEREE